MNSISGSIVIAAPKNKVFAYLANIENVPKWATAFALEVKVVDGKHKVTTPMGEMFLRIDADEKTGVLDTFRGPTEDQMVMGLSGRVVELPGDSSLLIFAVARPPGMSDEQFEEMSQHLLQELENIKKEFSQN